MNTNKKSNPQDTNKSHDHDISMAIKMNHKSFPAIEQLAQGESVDESAILNLVDYVDQRLDCADFRLVILLRCLYFYSEYIQDETLQEMKRSALGFKYWMDEPGEDSMCYWSENHQILFATCEYLTGQLYPDEYFSNDGMLGRYHMAKAEERMHIWLDLRFRFGFVEWHSNTYYEEDVAALSLLIDCCTDPNLVKKATCIMDLILLDMALHQHQSYMVATSGRCYEKQKKEPEQQDVNNIMKKAFGFQADQPYDFTKISADFILNKKYTVPEIIKEIAHDKETSIIKCSMGLDLSEIDQVFPNKEDILGRGMYLWSMESFSNPESCEIALKLYHDWKLSTNDFLKNLGALDIPVISKLGLLPTAIRILNPVTAGISIQRVNSYSYKHEEYFLSSAQKYHPATFGDQQHIWQATLAGGISVFTTHPGAAFFEENARNFSPSYWVGNGILPDCRQYKNVLLCAYDLGVRKGFMEKQRQKFTHAYFPRKKFDEVIQLNSRAILARKDRAYIALLSLHEMDLANDEEIKQYGKTQAWACVLGSSEENGTFQDFVQNFESVRLLAENITFRLQVLGKSFQLQFNQDFTVDNIVQEYEYPRLDSIYGTVERDPSVYNIHYGENTQRLDWPSRLYKPHTIPLSEENPYQKILDLTQDVVAKVDPKMKWMWGEALFGYALTLLDDYQDTDQFTPFLTRYCQYWLEHYPKIDYADRIAPALISYSMEKKTGNKDFQPLTQEAIAYIKNAPRLLEDAVNHFGNAFESKLYPQSIWVDSLMMFSVFPSLYGKEQNDLELLEYAARQPAIYSKYLQDPESGLWVHSYWTRAKRQHPRDKSFWGRGNGWVVASLPMILENLPDQHEEFPRIIEILQTTVKALANWQEEDGSFRTIINKKSYKEMSATALIAAGVLHSVRLGFIDKSYLGMGLKALDAVTRSIGKNDDYAYLSDISAPTIPLHLFPTTCYKLTPKGENWSYGLAGAIFAAIQYKKLQDEGII